MSMLSDAHVISPVLVSSCFPSSFMHRSLLEVNIESMC